MLILKNMERKELSKSSFDLFRTRIDIPGTDGHLEVTTIDVRKLHKLCDKIRPVAKAEKDPKAANPYETMVYRTDRDRRELKDLAELRQRVLNSAQSDDEEEPVYYLQAYSTREEAQFGHEEVVHSILSGFFFMQDEDGLSDYLFNPDAGDALDDDDDVDDDDFDAGLGRKQ